MSRGVDSEINVGERMERTVTDEQAEIARLRGDLEAAEIGLKAAEEEIARLRKQAKAWYDETVSESLRADIAESANAALLEGLKEICAFYESDMTDVQIVRRMNRVATQLLTQYAAPEGAD